MEPENRMISAEWLKTILYGICDEYSTERLHIDRIMDEIDNAPEVEVVRCKDCKHWECWRISGEGSGNCLLDIYGNLWNGNDYCSYGERRTDERKADCAD